MQVMVIGDVPAVGFMVSYAPNACVVGAALQLPLADHATEGPHKAQTAMHARSTLDPRGGPRFSILFGLHINAVSDKQTVRDAAAGLRFRGSRIRMRIRGRATSRRHGFA